MDTNTVWWHVCEVVLLVVVIGGVGYSTFIKRTELNKYQPGAVHEEIKEGTRWPFSFNIGIRGCAYTPDVEKPINALR